MTSTVTAGRGETNVINQNTLLVIGCIRSQPSTPKQVTVSPSSHSWPRQITMTATFFLSWSNWLRPWALTSNWSRPMKRITTRMALCFKRPVSLSQLHHPPKSRYRSMLTKTAGLCSATIHAALPWTGSGLKTRSMNINVEQNLASASIPSHAPNTAISRLTVDTSSKSP